MSDEMCTLIGIGIFILIVLVGTSAQDMFERYCKMKERISENKTKLEDTYITKQKDKK